MTLIERAARIAVDAHRTQLRKSDGSPYIVHPFMCATMLTRHHFREEVVAAALVHDVLEDTEVTEMTLREILGDEVVDIVKCVTEDQTMNWRAMEGGWEMVKQRYIDTVRSAPSDAKAVSIADKIHNMQSLLATYAEQGPRTWSHFNRGKEAKLWFEESVLAMFKETWHHPLVDEYEALVVQMRSLD